MYKNNCNKTCNLKQYHIYLQQFIAVDLAPGSILI